MSAENKIVVSVKNVAKDFKIPIDKSSGIKQTAVNLLKNRKGYRELHALRDISFEVREGDFFGIVGRNGSGKSTLLKTIAQIYTPDKGSVVVNGSLVPFIELGVGFNPELSGRENIYLNGALLGFSREEIDEMYDDIVDFAELGDFMEERLRNYSSGMQVRLAFSIAIRARGDILLLDEVLAVGDESFQKKCNDYFEQIRKDKNKTVILVTHSMAAVRKYCNKALLIDKSRIVATGDPNEVADEYSKQFLESTSTVIKEKGRFGSGKVKYKNIKKTYDEKYFVLDFDIVNQTKNDYDSITMGFDFCINGEIVIGNDTRFMEKYSNGVHLAPRQTKHFTIRFDNNFGNYDWTLNVNMTIDMGSDVVDYIRPAAKFSSNNIRHSNAFKSLSFPKITEKDVA